MQKTITQPNSVLSSIHAASFRPWLMLFSRSALFLLSQGLIVLVLFISGKNAAWNEAGRWWTSMATLANIGSFFLLVWLFKKEGRRFLDILRFSKKTWKIDLLWFIGFSIIAMPLASLPREPLAIAIFGDANVSTNLLFRPLPLWGFVLAFLFPATIAFAELPTYFGYCMPRLEKLLKNGWAAWIIASLFLAAQHIFLPFILNGGYLLWRFAMFLPFAFIVGLALKLRPQLLPYFVIGHALIDITTVLVYVMIPGGII